MSVYLSLRVFLKVEDAVTRRPVVRLGGRRDGEEPEGVAIHIRKLNLSKRQDSSYARILEYSAFQKRIMNILCLYVGMCVRERLGEREREGETGREIEREGRDVCGQLSNQM
jgi:hypothetical protein